MGHEGHSIHDEKPLGFFASPLHEGGHASAHHNSVSSESSNDLEHQKTANTDHVPFENTDCELHDNPAFHRHAEATTAELFYDLFFVANLTTFTSMLEINDHKSLTAYIGFFSLLWLTWYQVSLYDVRFSSDSIFERCAKAIHFGVMVGFAVIGPQWTPGQDVNDYKIYKAFGLILMVSRITLFLQYGVTLFYTRKFKKTIIPLALIMGSTLLAAILYGSLTPAFPNNKYITDEFGQQFYVAQKSDAYIAWYVIGICETLLTVVVSCVWRVISFKGTHMVQRMSLLTLIILGEGIIVVCKSISKIIKNEYLWTAAIIGQIVAAILIIYFLYMLYFDRLQEEHFGSIKQQVWSFLHFPLHTTLVLVLQGVSLLILWLQAIQACQAFFGDMNMVIGEIGVGNYSTGADAMADLNYTLYNHVYAFVPKGVDASKEISGNYWVMQDFMVDYDSYIQDMDNQTASDNIINELNDAWSMSIKTLFDSLGVNTPKKKDDGSKKGLIVEDTFFAYVNVFELVFTYVFVAVSFSAVLL